METLDLKRVLDLLDTERRTLIAAGVEGELLRELTRLHEPLLGWRQISFSALTERDADAVIAEQVRHYRALGASVEWTAYAHDAPSDLVARLERHGFEIGEREAVMVLDARAGAPWIDAPATHRVEQVTSIEALQTYRRVTEQVFGDDRAEMARELEVRLAEGSTENVAYLCFDGDVPASVGRLHTHARSRFGGLYGGGTLEGHRGRGLYRSCVARRVSDALRLGAHYVRVDALPTSQPILERLGFQLLTHSWPCVLPA